jgi:hypothetical protein
MRIFLQVATLIFLTAAAPANFIPPQIVFFLLGRSVVEKTLQKFHFPLTISIFSAALLVPPATAAPASPKTASPAALSPGFLFGASFIDRDGVAKKAPAVEFLDGGLSILLRFHFYEAETSIQAGVLILDDRNG